MIGTHLERAKKKNRKNILSFSSSSKTFKKRVLNTPVNLSFMLIVLIDMSNQGHHNQIECDDRFSVRICEMTISFQSESTLIYAIA